MPNVERYDVEEGFEYKTYPRIFILSAVAEVVFKGLMKLGGTAIYIGSGKWLMVMPDDDDETPIRH